MKRIIHIIFIVGAVSVWQQAFADDAKSTDWGVTNCGAQMSIKLEGSGNEVKTNQPVILAICITNVSDGVLNIADGNLAVDFSFVVISPLNKDISPKALPNNDLIFRNILVDIQPNGTMNYSFNLSSKCSFNEIGTYKVTAKRKVIGGCELVSNTLKVPVVPGEWKSETTNASPYGFGSKGGFF